MKVGTLVATAGIAGCILLAGCGDGSGSGGGSGSGPKVLNVKGLYLGMDINEAHAVLTKLLKESPLKGTTILGMEMVGKVTREHDFLRSLGYSEDRLKTVENEFFFTNVGGEGLNFKADVNGKVTSFEIPGLLVEFIFGIRDDLFGSSKMEDSDFVQSFINHYNIPQFKVSDDYSRWYFDSPHEYRVEIKEGKDLIVKQSPKAKFN